MGLGVGVLPEKQQLVLATSDLSSASVMLPVSLLVTATIPFAPSVSGGTVVATGQAPASVMVLALMSFPQVLLPAKDFVSMGYGGVCWTIGLVSPTHPLP